VIKKSRKKRRFDQMVGIFAAEPRNEALTGFGEGEHCHKEGSKLFED